MAFAKLFERSGMQALVKMDVDGDERPEVRVYFEPDGCGVCSLVVTFKDDSEENWKKCEEMFASIDENEAFRMVDDFLAKNDIDAIFSEEYRKKMRKLH